MKKLSGMVAFMLMAYTGTFALEVTLSQTVTNLTFPAQTEVSNTSFTAKDFFFGTDLVLNTELSPGVSLSGGYQMDAVIRKRVFANFLYQTDYVSLGVGPYFGIFNTSKSLAAPGIETFFQFSFPNLMFVSVNFQSTLAPLIKAGDYYQNDGRLGMGLSLPNGVVGLAGNISRFSELTSSGITTDEIKAVEFTSEVFFKNNPFKFGADFRFQNYSREFQPNAKVFSVYSGIVTVSANLILTPQWQIFASSSSSLLNFGYGDYAQGASTFNPDPMAYIFSANLGLTWTLE